jgi:hypothetical protein
MGLHDLLRGGALLFLYVDDFRIFHEIRLWPPRSVTGMALLHYV